MVGGAEEELFIYSLYIYMFSINLLAFYHECCSLIGYTTIYLVVESEKSEKPNNVWLSTK